LKSTTFAVDLLAYARSLRAFSHDFPQSRTFDFRKTIMRKQEHVFQKDHAQTQRPAAIRPLGITGKVPVRPERMDAIRNIKTMAGSPDADDVSASRNLAHGFCILDVRFFREPMKENHDV
jgi:hypothetical protein